MDHDRRRIARVQMLMADGKWKEARREAEHIRGRKEREHWLDEIERTATGATA